MKPFVESGIFQGGKYDGASVEEMADEDPAYLRWTLREVKNLDEYEYVLIKEVLEERGIGTTF